MEHRDGSVELRLNRWVTRNSEGHTAKLCWVASGMVMLGNCWCHECGAHADKQHHGQENGWLHGGLLGW
jgi:hypothetical protein